MIGVGILRAHDQVLWWRVSRRRWWSSSRRWWRDLCGEELLPVCPPLLHVVIWLQELVHDSMCFHRVVLGFRTIVQRSAHSVATCATKLDAAAILAPFVVEEHDICKRLLDEGLTTRFPTCELNHERNWESGLCGWFHVLSANEPTRHSFSQALSSTLPKI